ncbi:MAG: hypothetical protein EOP11_05720 [Proteobacteria bacterium]|nr:MAG: hypothetical protein EOP11_05720 [Pseudomonadota bacterium]
MWAATRLPKLRSIAPLEISKSAAWLNTGMKKNMPQAKANAGPLGKEREIFASFKLGHTEFAMPIVHLQEVVPCPADIVQVPMAPSYLIGLFNLRGLVIPIVNAADILKLQMGPATPERRVAILEQDGVRVGLLFDATSEILSVNPAEMALFAEGERGHHGAVKGALKLGNGDRILQVLDPAAFLKIENIPLVRAEEAKGSLRARKTKRSQCITFRAGDMRFALPIVAIREIIKVPEVQPSVLNYEYSIGMVNLRGTVVPVLDLAKFLAIPAPAVSDPENHRIIVLKIGAHHFGFLVASVENITAYYEEELLPIPMFKQPKADLFRGILAGAVGEETIFLNEARLLDDEEVKHLTKGHSALYGEARVEKSAARSLRRTFLNFRLQDLFSLPLSAVDEIAHCAENLLCPPGYPSFVKGILKMRGEVITVIDLRVFYGMPKLAEAPEAKVLIISGANGRYGLLVDTVDSICTVEDADKIPIPSLLQSDTARAVESDMAEVAEMKDASGTARTYMVLDLARLMARLEARAA